MKKFTSLLIVVSLALAGAALAQQPEEQSTPKSQDEAAPEKTEKAEPKTPKTRGESAAKPEATAAKQTGAVKEQGATGEPGAGKGRKVQATDAPAASKALKAETTPKSEKTTGTETNVSGQPSASATPGAEHGKKGMKATGANAKTSPSATPATAAKTTATPVTAATASATPATAASASAAPVTAASASATPATAASASAAPSVAAKGAAAKQPDPQQVQQITQQHANFKAQPRPDKVPTVTFSASYRIQGSDRWQGPQYEVYRSYHPERHDRGWYTSRYNRVQLISGGYYYWNNGYWFPAWGYDSSAQYYAYDAPIYVGHRAEPPDRVIANVQAVLQNMGYYRGEVDGLLGPLTREALTAYQADRGLTATAVIDEPTLDSLGMG